MRSLLLILCFAIITQGHAVNKPIHRKIVLIDFYYQPGCKKCHRIRSLLLPELAETCRGKYRLQVLSTGNKANYLQLLSIMNKLKENSNDTAYMVINSHIILAGDNIEKKLIDTVNVEYASYNKVQGQKTDNGDSLKILESRANSFTIGTIIIAGLLDGVNPCVFSTLVFFISLLSVAKVNKRKMFWVGTIYCISCFVTYLSIGFGVFSCLRALSGFDIFRLIINDLISVILLIFAGISFIDCYRYKTSKKAESVSLKLPETVSKLIHKIMKEGLSFKALLPGVFFVGSLVTVLESVCTGQVYIPTLVLMTKESSSVKWFSLLLLYNLMFIIPLAIIFIAFYNGANTPKLIKWSKKNVVFSKFSLGCFFVLLAVLIQVF